jgi:adenosylmethionine-8-amino-7-oxononanoate aminotransferase
LTIRASARSCIRTAYTGNPLACAAALASLAIFDSDDVLARNLQTAARMAELAAPFAGHAHVADVRHADDRRRSSWHGMATGARPSIPAQRIGQHAYRAALQRGVVLRPLRRHPVLDAALLHR